VDVIAHEIRLQGERPEVMGWLSNLFAKYPEMAVYLAVGTGYAVGRFKVRGVGLGVATLGYLYTVAFGHILLTTWGTLIVYFLS
jgi:hypothetical protein